MREELTPQLEDIKSPARLLEVLKGPCVVIYFYHDWRRTNEDFGCDVCDEFGACSAEDFVAEFYEVSVPALMREIDWGMALRYGRSDEC